MLKPHKCIWNEFSAFIIILMININGIIDMKNKMHTYYLIILLILEYHLLTIFTFYL